MKNYKIIDSNYFADVDKNTIDEIVTSFSYNKDLVYNTHKWSNYLKNYLILTHMGDNKIDRLSLYMSRYYWLKKFYHHYSITYGKDVGIEQQIVQILESIGNEYEDFDWYEIQEINQNIENEI